MSLSFSDVSDSGNDLVQSSNKPLPEPMLIQIYAASLYH